MKQTKIRSLIGVLFLLVLEGCVSGDEKAASNWEDPVVSEAEINQVEGQINPQTKPLETREQEDQLDVSTPPWKPDLREGDKVYEDSLTFENTDREKQIQPELERSFDSASGYGPDGVEDQGAAVTPPPVEDSAPVQEIVEGDSTFKTRWVTAARLNIRSQPSARSAIVGTLTKGETVVVILQEGKWSRIGPQQYVSSRYLSSHQ